MTVLMICAAVFAVSAGTKLFDRSSFITSVESFGVPLQHAKPVATAVIALEIAVAIGLLFAETAALAAAGGVALLAVFSAAITRLLRKGERPSCKCFGALSEAPIGWPSLVRNGAIAALLVVSWFNQPETGAAGAIADLATENSTASILVAGQLLLLGAGVAATRMVLAGQRQLRQDLRRMADELDARPPAAGDSLVAPGPGAGLPIGSFAPELDLTDSGGASHSLAAVRSELTSQSSIVLFFVSPSCRPCQELLPEVETWRSVHGAGTRFVVVSSGSAAATEHQTDTYFSLDDPGAQYRADYTPAAVVIRPDGRIASHVSYGIEAISDLVFDVVTGAAIAPAEVGATTPTLEAANLEPAPGIDLSARSRLYLFWNSDCPFCADLAPTLAQHHPDGSLPAIVFVTKDADPAASALGHSVYRDASGELSQRFGVGGTPSAVLITADDRQASQLAVGAEDVQRLLGPTSQPIPIDVDETSY